MDGQQVLARTWQQLCKQPRTCHYSRQPRGVVNSRGSWILWWRRRPLSLDNDRKRMFIELINFPLICCTSTTSSPRPPQIEAILWRIIERLLPEFAMTDLGALHHFLGISVSCSSNGGMFLSQWQYAVDLLHRVVMAMCLSTSTPVDARAKLSATDGAPVADDPTEYSLTSAL